jgi:hypothetical protein
MKKVFMAAITCMTVLANVFAGDTKLPESKNEICIAIDKAMWRNNYMQTSKFGKIPDPRETLWTTDAKIAADYCRYITKDNRLGLGLGFTIQPLFEFYDIYGMAKFRIPLNGIIHLDYWFLGAGVGFGNLDGITDPMYKMNSHEYYKLFTGFNFKNISIYLSYAQDIIYGEIIGYDSSFTSRYKALNLDIGTRFTI